MLTIKSRFTNFYNRQGQPVTAADLDVLKKVISEDIVNFRGNVSYGFTADIAKEIVSRIAVSKDAKICLLTDISFHLLLALLEAGFKRENIYIAAGKWITHKNKAVPSSTDATYMILKRHAAASFNEEINIIKLEEMFDLKFDLIIANPPYGSIGAQITNTIREKVDYQQYINLLPISYYTKSDSQLFKYVEVLDSLSRDLFEDARVTPYICRINKYASNVDRNTFEVLSYPDKTLHKYFMTNRKRTYVPFDESKSWIYFTDTVDCKTSVLLDHRFIANGHLAYSKNTAEYKWNVEKSIDVAWLEANISCPSVKGKLNKFVITFDTEIECTNFTNWGYSKDGFKFIAKIACGLGLDSTVDLGYILPKVDWTRAWTVEEILADYGYTVEEINEIMESLKGIKDMERD